MQEDQKHTEVWRRRWRCVDSDPWQKGPKMLTVPLKGTRPNGALSRSLLRESRDLPRKRCKFSHTPWLRLGGEQRRGWPKTLDSGGLSWNREIRLLPSLNAHPPASGREVKPRLLPHRLRVH